MGGDRYLVGVPRDRDRVPMVRDGDAVRVAGDRGRVGVCRNGEPVRVVVYGVRVRRDGMGVGRVDMGTGIHPYFVSVRNHGPVFIHAPIYCNPHSVMEAVVVDRLPGGLAREDVRAFEGRRAGGGPAAAGGGLSAAACGGRGGPAPVLACTGLVVAGGGG